MSETATEAGGKPRSVTVKSRAAGPEIQTPVGSAPIVPLIMLGAGAYLLWFGVKYWRGQGAAIWPSYVVKSILQGHGIPPQQPAAAASVQVDAYEQQLGGQIGQQETGATGPAGPPGGGSTSGATLVNDERQYAGKVPYVWGGANPRHGWDCSGMQNWCIGHDLNLDIPGIPRGKRFDGSTHGPDVAGWLNWKGAARVAGPPKAGDLVCWGPNSHMGMAIDATNMISALDPALGTRITPIAVTHVGVPTYLRLRATVGAPGPGGQPQHIARLLLSRFGWGPDQMPPLISLWNRESGWSPHAKNPSSGALGIAQALGHGGPNTAGSLGNEYGTQFGLSVQDAQAANSGAALPQIRWGLGYIAARPNPYGPTYGSPAAAWQHEQALGWY